LTSSPHFKTTDQWVIGTGDQFCVGDNITVDQIEKLIGANVVGSKIENELKYLKPAKSWALPKNCQIG
jgi:hypothetical protein